MSLKNYLLQNLDMNYQTDDSPLKRLVKRATGGYIYDDLMNKKQLNSSINKSNASVPKSTGLTQEDTTTPPPMPDIANNTQDTGSNIETPHTDIQYTANKLNELSYGTSPADLFSMRQRLARDQALAKVGQLPTDSPLNPVFDGLGITQGTPNYNYEQRMDVNKATADIYEPQINVLDDLIKKSSKSGDDELTTSQKVNTFNKIVNEYNKSPLIRAAERTPVLSGTIDAVLKDPKNSALQLNLSYAYVQALDTYQSAVREGELNNLNSIDSKIGQIQNYVQKMGNGQIMRPEIAKQVAESAKSIVDLINTAAKQKAKSFKSQAQVSGIGDQWDQYTGGFDAVYDKESDSDEEIITDDQGNQYRVNPDGSATQILSKVGSGTKQASGKEIVAGYDITSYATDPLHGKKVQNIYSKIPENLDAYISRIAPNSPIKAHNVLASANKYGVDPKLVLAIMVQDSTLGTAGKAVRTRNPGNVGNTDSGATRTYATWQDGVDAVAKNLSRRKIYNV